MKKTIATALAAAALLGPVFPCEEAKRLKVEVKRLQEELKRLKKPVTHGAMAGVVVTDELRAHYIQYSLGWRGLYGGVGLYDGEPGVHGGVLITF